MKKKFCAIITVVIIILSMFSLGACENKVYDVKKTDIQVDCASQVLDNLSILSSTYANRTTGSQAQTDVVNFLQDYMQNLNYEVQQQKFSVVNQDMEGINVICKKTNPSSKKTILLTCNYDNCYELLDLNPDGAYGSGVATAILMEISSILSDKSLPYNLEIVYFSGGHQIWAGAKYFLGVSDTKYDLVINYALLGGGDNLYMYSRDFKTSYNEFFYEVALAHNLSFTKVPQDKRIIEAIFDENATYAYSHIGMMGNNYPFLNKSIPTISYLSCNWEDRTYPAYTEIKDKNNVFETNHDTYKNMLDRVGVQKLSNSINSVINSTTITIVDNSTGLLKELEQPDEIPSFIQSNIVEFMFGLVIKVLLIVGIIIIIVRQKDKAKDDEELQKLMQNILKEFENGPQSFVEKDPFDFEEDDIFSDKEDNNKA